MLSNLSLRKKPIRQFQLLLRILGFAIFFLILFLGFGHITHADENKSITVSVPTLNVRANAELSASIISKIHKGETYAVVGKSGDWDQIQLSNQQTGWVANWLITEVKKNKETQASNSQMAITSKVKGLNVHVANDFDSSVIGQIYPTESYPLLQDGGQLTQIQTKKAKGWVATRLVNKQSVEGSKPYQAVVQAPILNVRKQPGVSNGVVTQLKSGQTVTVTDQNKGWAKISFDGKEGWISKQYISKESKGVAVTKESHPSNVQNKDTQNISDRKTATLNGKTIVLDPGHGGKDNGTTSIKGVPEKELTLETADTVAKKLKAAGAHVILTRTNDRFISLQNRVEISKQDQADAFISLHYNYSKFPTVKGIQNFYYNKSRDGALASAIHNALIKGTGLIDRGFGFDNLYVLRNNSHPSTLIELGFLSNKNEESVVETSTYQEKVAKAVYLGLLNYFSN